MLFAPESPSVTLCSDELNCESEQGNTSELSPSTVRSLNPTILMNHSGSDPHYRRNQRYQYRHSDASDGNYLRCLRSRHRPNQRSFTGVIGKASTPSKTPSLSESTGAVEYSITKVNCFLVRYIKRGLRAKTLAATATILRIARSGLSHRAPDSPIGVIEIFLGDPCPTALHLNRSHPTRVGDSPPSFALSELIARFVRQLASVSYHRSAGSHLRC